MEISNFETDYSRHRPNGKNAYDFRGSISKLTKNVTYYLVPMKEVREVYSDGLLVRYIQWHSRGGLRGLQPQWHTQHLP